MAGWHTRLWRRVNVAPGLTINLSRSGPSLSVGLCGARTTLDRRVLRQTPRIPGTGICSTRQLTGLPNRTITADDLAVIGGIATEVLAQHHPRPPKSIAPVVAGLISTASALVIAVGVAVVGAVLLGARTSGSSRRYGRAW